jgi:pyruvate ferredoxin oxidoreductase beta subunit
MEHTVVKFYQTGTFTVGNRLLAPDQRSVQANMQRTNSLNSGHRACQGCGEALGARYAIDAAMQRATNGQLIAANATGCLEVFSTPYPETSWQMPWIHSLFGNTAAVATGIAAAMRVKGRSQDVRVVAQGGDGGTTDIGFGCLSGMFERNDDVLYICYDNEAYMNTGVQRSSATPPAARTATTMPSARARATLRPGQERAAIAMAHEIPYVATATVADLRDLEYKVTKAMSIRGARYIHIFVPCPLGWGAASHDTIRWRGWRMERCVPGVRGRARRSHGGLEDPPARAGRRIPAAAEALCPPLRQHAGPTLARLHHGRSQHPALRAAGHSTLAMAWLDPHPIAFAQLAARVRQPQTALQPPVPRRGKHPGIGCFMRSRGTTSRPGASWSKTTRSPPPWVGSVITPAKGPATGRRSMRRWESTRSRGFWVIRPSPGAGGSRLQRRNPERRCWLSARVRPASRRPTTWRAWAMP